MAQRVVINGEELIRALQEMARLGLDTAPAMELVAVDWRNRVKAGFAYSRDPYGTPWKPTIRPGQPLWDTGRLVNSVQHKSTKKSAIVGTNTCYAIAHQTGAFIEAGKPPHTSLCEYKTKGSPFLRFQIGRNGPWVTKKAVTIPRRPIFPADDLGGLPETWEKGAARALINHLRKGLK